MTKLYRKYRYRGFIVVAINYFDDTQEQVEDYIDETDLDVPVLLEGKELSRQCEVEVGPVSIWINRDGKIVEHAFGFSPDATGSLEKKVLDLLEEHDNANPVTADSER